jgi:hypothetical protein
MGFFQIYNVLQMKGIFAEADLVGAPFSLYFSSQFLRVLP